MTLIGLVFGSEFWNIINFKIHHLRSYTGKSKNTTRTRMLHFNRVRQPFMRLPLSKVIAKHNM